MERDFAYKGKICKIDNKTTNVNKKYKEKENNDKMISQFLRANSISINLVPSNGVKNLIGARKITGVVV